jgi:hypothetical protein
VTEQLGYCPLAAVTSFAQEIRIAKCRFQCFPALCFTFLVNGASAANHNALLGRCAAKMKLHVECYSGRKAEERPVRFQLDGHSYMVKELLDQWYGPDDVFFKVLADDGNLYILKKETSTSEGSWSLVSFRRLEEER